MSVVLFAAAGLKSSKDISFVHVMFSWLFVDSCYSTEPDQVFLDRVAVPVGARQAVAVPPPAQRHVPGPGLSSPPLLPSGLP